MMHRQERKIKKTASPKGRPAKGINTPIFLLMKMIGGLILNLRYRIRIQGREYLPKTGAFILLPKHQQWWDILLIGWAAANPLYYMAKHELFINPISGWFLRAIGGIPINRAKPLASRQSLARMLGLLDKGSGMVIFPEGTYYANRVGPVRSGLIKMIRARMDMPFIPVGIRYETRKGRDLVKIRFGTPLRPETVATIELFLEKVMKEIAILSELWNGKGSSLDSEPVADRGRKIMEE